MVASIGQMASAEYYLESQRSFRHPNEYYTAGEEPGRHLVQPQGPVRTAGRGEGGLAALPAALQRLRTRRVRQARSARRQPGALARNRHDLLRRQERVSALWAIADPEIAPEASRRWRRKPRERRWKTRVHKHCSYTRMAEKGVTRPVEADLMGATFVHGTSRENDPQLHVHCTIFNVAQDPRGRQVAGAPPVPGLQLEEGGRSAVPRQSGLGGCNRASGCGWSSTAPTQRVHPYRRHAGRSARPSGPSGERPSSRWRANSGFRRSATPRAWRG